MQDFLDLLRQPLMLEALVGIVLFVVVLLTFRRVRKIAEELERRKELGEYVRGLDEFLRGDFRVAVQTLERVLERDPENVEARIALGDCYRGLGDAAEAKKHHHHVHKVFGHDLTRNFVSLGLDDLALKNYDRAVEAFERVLELTPGEPDALAGLAQAYAEGGNPIEAARYLRELYPHGPAADMHLKQRRAAAKRFAEAGHALLADGDAEGAVRLFTEALTFQPQSIRARTGIVRAAHALGDEERARKIVEEHVGTLKQLAADEEVLFEPAAARPAERAAGETPPPGEETASLLPARIEDLGGVVAAVEQKTARYTCAQCGALVRDYAEVCPACKGVGTLEPLPVLAKLYTMPVQDFRAAVDEVEENTAFLQALAHKAATGDDEAMARLLEKGAGALYEVFAALPALEGRRYLGARLAALGPEAAREVRQCHAARAGSFGGGARPADEFAAAYYLALGADDAASFLPSLGEAHDIAVAGVMADARVADEVRDAARERLKTRGAASLVPVVDTAAASGDFGGIERGAQLLREWGADAVEEVERRYLQATLLGRIFRGKRGARRRAAADILARTGLPAALDVLARAAAKEKDDKLRAHYVAARERAEKGGPAS